MRMNRYDKRIMQSERRKRNLEGKGLYVYQNTSSGDLFLPKPTKSGVTRVGLNEEFQGDDYYMFMLGTRELRLVRVIENPAAQLAESKMMEDKLITEQPPVVTNEGTVEFVKKSEKLKKLNENQPYQLPADDVLLNENPLEGIEII